MILIKLVQKYWLIVTIVLLAVITYYSVYPLPELPKIANSDKLHHLVAYAGLAIPVSMAFPKKIFPILLSFIIYSGILELIQTQVNRYGEWLDLLANATGILIGFLLGRAGFYLIRKWSMSN